MRLFQKKMRFPLTIALLVATFLVVATIARDHIAAQSARSDIVLRATVKACHIVGPEWRIDVAPDTVIAGAHGWVVSFHVDEVVSGDFPLSDVNVLVHSPSEFGVRSSGDRFTLRISRQTKGIRVISAPGESSSHAAWNLAFGDPTYSIVASTREP